MLSFEELISNLRIGKTSHNLPRLTKQFFDSLTDRPKLPIMHFFGQEIETTNTLNVVRNGLITFRCWPALINNSYLNTT